MSKFKKRSCDPGQQEHNVGTKRSDSPFRRSVGDRVSMVPELHSGLLDLIRVLGKLAHSASRTTIICEPFVPFHTSTRYHKNCNGSPSPIEKSLKQLRNRPSSFWNPVQPKTYYYNCFNYQNVPARNEHYKEIDDKYEQIKQIKLCYDPPECDDDHINKLLSDSDHDIRHKDHNDRLRNEAQNSGRGYQHPAKATSAHSIRPVESKGISVRPETSSTQAQRTKTEMSSVKSGLDGVKSDPLLLNSGSNSVKLEPKYGKTESMNARPDHMNLKSESKLGKQEPRNVKPESKYGKEDSVNIKPESRSKQPELKSAMPPGSKSMIAESDEKRRRAQKAEKSSNEIFSNDGRSALSIHSATLKSTCELEEGSGSDTEPQVCKLPKTSASSKKSLKSAKSTEDAYKSDVEELKEMIQKLENENLLRYQAMLNLMREMSTKDFCRATCDKEMSSNSFCRGTSAREMKSFKDCGSSGRVAEDVTSNISGGDLSVKSKKCARFDSDQATTSGSSLLPSDSDKSFKLPSQGTPKQIASQSKLSLGNQDRLSKTACLVGNAEMTLQDLMEMSSVIADVVVFETVKELMRKYKYRPPCKESASKSFEKEEQGTIDSPFETASSLKAGPSGKLGGSTKKIYDEPMSGRASGKNVEKPSLMEDTSVNREQFVEAQSVRSSNGSKHQLSTMAESSGEKIKTPSNKGSTEGPRSERESAFSDRSKTLENKPPVKPIVSATPKSENLKPDNGASEPRRNPACPKHGTSPVRSSAGSEFQDVHDNRKNVKSSCRKFDTAPPTRPEGRPSPCSENRPKSHPQDNSATPGPVQGPEIRQSVLSTCRQFNTAPSTNTEIRPSPDADQYLAKSGVTDHLKGPMRETLTDNTDGTALYFTKTTKNAFPPQKDTPNAAGFMLRSAHDYTMQPRSIISVKTDLIVELPPNSYGRLAPRNCLTKNFGINVIGDVIDHDYDDTVTVVLINHSEAEVPIKRGAKIAQLIVEKIHQPKLREKKDQSQSK